MDSGLLLLKAVTVIESMTCHCRRCHHWIEGVQKFGAIRERCGRLSKQLAAHIFISNPQLLSHVLV